MKAKNDTNNKNVRPFNIKAEKNVWGNNTTTFKFYDVNVLE